MTNAELNAKAAEIMGYWFQPNIIEPCYLNQYKQDCIRVNWNPVEDISQAFEVAEKLCMRYSLIKHENGYFYFEFKGTAGLQSSQYQAATKELAIVGACCAAYNANKEKV